MDVDCHRRWTPWVTTWFLFSKWRLSVNGWIYYLNMEKVPINAFLIIVEMTVIMIIYRNIGNDLCTECFCNDIVSLLKSQIWLFSVSYDDKYAVCLHWRWRTCAQNKWTEMDPCVPLAGSKGEVGGDRVGCGVSAGTVGAVNQPPTGGAQKPLILLLFVVVEELFLWPLTFVCGSTKNAGYVFQITSSSILDLETSSFIPSSHRLATQGCYNWPCWQISFIYNITSINIGATCWLFSVTAGKC